MEQEPPTLTRTLAFRLTDGDAKRIERLAAQHERTVGDMLRRIVRQGLKLLERAK